MRVSKEQYHNGLEDEMKTNMTEDKMDYQKVWQEAHRNADCSRGVCKKCLENLEKDGGSVDYIIGTRFVGSAGRKLHLYRINQHGIEGYCGNATMKHAYNDKSVSTKVEVSVEMTVNRLKKCLACWENVGTWYEETKKEVEG